MKEVSVGFFTLTYAEGFADMILFVINRHNKEVIKSVFFIPYLISEIEKINYSSEYIFARNNQLFLIPHEPDISFDDDGLDKVSIYLNKSEIQILIDVLNTEKNYSDKFSEYDNNGILKIGVVDINSFFRILDES